MRAAVLAGRFFGNQHPEPDLVALVASRDPAVHLRLWFGTEWLAGLRVAETPGGTLRAALDCDIAALDAMLTEQLDAILHEERFRRLEGSWRGLQWLIGYQVNSQSRRRVRLLSVTWREVCKDLERALEFDQTELFRKIYEEQFGTAGGEPFGLIACDYEIRHRPSREHPTDDIAALSALGGIAAAAFSPMVFGASPQLFGVDSFADIPASVDLSAAFRDSEHARWRQLTTQEDLRFLGVVLPRMLGRPPWPDDGVRADGFRFRHRAGGADSRVWINAVYGLAAVALRAFERSAWPAEVRGAEIAEDAMGGVLDRLPTERFPSDPPDGDPPRAPLELALTDLQEDQLSQTGLIPLAALELLPEACFGALPSLYHPPRTNQAAANANQRVSSQLNTLLCASRFAHCIKLMGRDMVGSYLEPDQVETRLQRWLSSYVGGTGLSSLDATARYPLRDAQVEVRERRGFPGVYQCTVQLMPHHQLDEIGASFRLVTEFVQRNADQMP